MFVKEITKRYDGKAVVDGVSFEVPKGKVLFPHRSERRRKIPP